MVTCPEGLDVHQPLPEQQSDQTVDFQISEAICCKRPGLKDPGHGTPSVSAAVSQTLLQ